MGNALTPLHNSAWRSFLATHALVIERIQQDLAEAQMPPLEWYDVLFALAEAPGQRLRLHELAATVLISRSTITRLVDRLETSGLLYRERCTSDRRGSFAVLTEAGQAMQNQMWQVYGQSIAQHFAQRLNSDEANVLLGLCRQIAANPFPVDQS